MAALTLRSAKKHCAVALLLVALAAATCAVLGAAQSTATVDPATLYPVVTCPSTITRCLQCRSVPNGLTFCAACEDGYSTAIPSGTCEVYSGKCSVAGCARCTSTSDMQCAMCAAGYTLDYTTFQCTAASIAAPTSSITAPTSSTMMMTPTPCQVNACAMCSIGLPNVCVMCAQGYTLMVRGDCKPTGTCNVRKCSQCYADDDTFCATCSFGYRSTTTGTCKRSRNGAAHTHPTAIIAVVVAAVAYAATML